MQRRRLNWHFSKHPNRLLMTVSHIILNDAILDLRSDWIIIHDKHSFNSSLNVAFSNQERLKKKGKFTKSDFFSDTIKLYLVMEIKYEGDRISQLCFLT